MPIERVIVRMLIMITVVAVIATLTFYPPSFVMLPLVFLFICISAEFALPKDSKNDPKGLPKTVSKMLFKKCCSKNATPKLLLQNRRNFGNQ